MLVLLLVGGLMGMMESALLVIHSERRMAARFASWEVWRAVALRVVVHWASVMMLQWAEACEVEGSCLVVAMVK